MKDDEAERSAYEQGREDGYSLGWAAVQEQINGLHNSLDAHDEMIKQLKAERDAAYVRGLEMAKKIAKTFWYDCETFDDAIQAKIDRAKLD